MSGSFKELNPVQKTCYVLGTVIVLAVIIIVLALLGKWLMHVYLWLWHRA